MTEDQGQQSKAASLAEKLTRINVTGFEIVAKEENIDMLYIQNLLICSVDYALSMSDKDLKELIAETIGA